VTDLGSADEVHPLLHLAADLEYSPLQSTEPVCSDLDFLTRKMTNSVRYQEARR
jgi:hypothetical protein